MWQDVWICPAANGHIQATGTDAAGRLQYLYHPWFREQREAAKHEHILEVAPARPLLCKHAAEYPDARGLCRDRVLACAARVLDLGFFRIGNESYRRDNVTYGLTTPLREHVSWTRSTTPTSRGTATPVSASTCAEPVTPRARSPTST